MIAEALFTESPRDFCLLAKAMEVQYKDLPLYVIYFHQFALHDVADAKEENAFIYFVDDYAANTFPELEGYAKLSLYLNDNGSVERYELAVGCEEMKAT
jgi:hypothetical protein